MREFFVDSRATYVVPRTEPVTACTGGIITTRRLLLLLLMLRLLLLRRCDAEEDRIVITTVEPPTLTAVRGVAVILTFLDKEEEVIVQRALVAAGETAIVNADMVFFQLVSFLPCA